jgi:mTERF domain-containing protein
MTNQFLLSTALPPTAFAVTVKSHITFPNFCTHTTPSTTPPGQGVVTEFLINKCGLTPEEIAKTFRHNSKVLLAKSSKNLEEVLELLKGCGLTTPSQIRRVVLYNHWFLFLRAERNIQPKLSLLRTFMKEEDISALILRNARLFGGREDKLKSAISLLQRLGVEGHVLSQLVAKQPRLLTTSEERVLEAFKLAEDLGFKKESKMFAVTLNKIWGVRKETIDRRRQCLSSSGFSEKQISELAPWVLGYTEETLKKKVEFVVKTAGFSLDDVVKYPVMLGYSLEKRMIPRYRVTEALKSMQVLETEKTFLHILKLPERLFLERYVHSSALLRDIYHDGKAENSIIDKETCNERVAVEKIYKDLERSPAPSI